MANKRMFTLTVVNTDAFLEMPCSTQALYFHLCMRADDDGFVASPKIITRTVGASEDDLKLLVAKRFVLVFEDGVIVIKHWRMHNTLSVGRYKETAYLEHKALLKLKPNNAYSLNEGEPLEDSRLIELGKRQVKMIDEQKTNNRRTIDEQKTNTDKNRIDKNRIDKNSIEEESIGEYEGDKPPRAPKEPKHKYGEYKHVMLKDSDIEKLNNEIGIDLTQACITHLDEYIEMKGYKAKNHYLAIKKWVIDAVKERQSKRQNQPSSTAQELDDFYNMSSDWVDRMGSEESDS